MNVKKIIIILPQIVLDYIIYILYIKQYILIHFSGILHDYVIKTSIVQYFLFEI